jgi:hypothetical protein
MRLAIVLSAAALLGSGCKKNEKPPTGDAGGPAAVAPAALPPLGVANPWPKSSPEAHKAYVEMIKLTRAKKLDEARKAIDHAVELSPDSPVLRLAQLSATVRQGDWRSMPQLCEQLAMRFLPDAMVFVARSEKTASPFSKAPEMAACKQSIDKYRAAWTRDVDKGFLFVARDSGAKEPRFDDKGDAGLAASQTVWLYHAADNRFVPMTATSDRAYALHRSPDGKTLSVLAVHQLHRENQVDSFVDPEVLVIGLSGFDRAGPFPQRGRFEQVVLGTNAAGAPLFTFTVSTGKSETYTIDTARTGLAHLEGGAVVPSGDETRAWPNQVTHVSSKEAADVKLTDGANQFVIARAGGEPITVTAARAVAQGSIGWSPGKVKLTYAGKLDPCRTAKGAAPEKNELFVYDVQKRSAQRVAAAVSQFETLWLDDDRLVYEGGVGPAGQLHVYAFTAHADTALPSRHGAGLYGVPTLTCEAAETGVDEDLGETPDDEGD